ncbi:MAG: MFS transporter, partial [Verrucomicrobia bacterium]|nr:MFS transporter [Verrucomicrobiota bacterium]
MANTAQADTGFIAKFTVLKGASRELWITFVVKLLGVMAYKMTVMTLSLWLISDFGYGDVSAGSVVAAWTISMTIVTLLVGSLTDAVGLRRTFFLGVWICIVARAVMAFTTIKWVALGAGLFPLAVGEALGTPVLVAAVRKYSTTQQRSISYSLFYTIMNLGFLVAAFLFDYFRHRLGERG